MLDGPVKARVIRVLQQPGGGVVGRVPGPLQNETQGRVEQVWEVVAKLVEECGPTFDGKVRFIE